MTLVHWCSGFFGFFRPRPCSSVLRSLARQTLMPEYFPLFILYIQQNAHLKIIDANTIVRRGEKAGYLGGVSSSYNRSAHGKGQ